MKRKGIITVLLLLLLLVCGGAWLGKRYIDNKVANNQRIVATSAAITEIFAKLDIKLVGVPQTAAKLPPAYRHVAKIGSPMEPNVEKIAALNPTKVYAVSTLKDQYDTAFKKESVGVDYLQLDSVAQLESTLNKLGQQYYRQKQAADQIGLIKAAIVRAQKRAHGRKPRVLILMGLPGANYMILTNKSYLGDLVRIAGGQNLYQSRSQVYLPASNESLADKRPDVILRLEHALPRVTLPQFKHEFKHNPIWQKMPAVKNGRVYDLQQPDFNASANMNVSIALKKLSNYLYPQK
jgi:iron complex transport system substrate-binding protein